MKKRIFDAEHMRKGIGHVLSLRSKAVEHMPQALAQSGEPEPEVLESHCVKCKGRSKFAVEGESTMKNGAIRKYGKCQNDNCGTMMSIFVAGAKESTNGS